MVGTLVNRRCRLAFDNAQGAPLLITKLHVPKPRPGLVSRSHLIRRLDEGICLGGSLSLVSAPAGYGKTTLLGEWVAGCGWPVAWISLDEGDNAPPRFLAYLVAALRTVEEGIGRGVLGAFQDPKPPPIESILSALLNEIAAVPTCFVLVLDDYHVIKARSVHDALTFLLDHLPSQMHLVIATRTDPPLPLARLRARGRLIELRQSDLRFTSDEAGEFLNRFAGLNLSADHVAALVSHTEGWAAGLQMAAVSIRGRDDVASFVRAFTGSNRYVIDYLTEEVLQRQPESIQAFWLQTAILDRLSGSLCDAVTGGDDGQATLELLERENLFIVPLDDERRWYRYHHLFRDLMRQRLHRARPDLVSALHRRASEWYERNGLVAAAVDHALSSGDFERATRLLDGCVDVLWGYGEQAALLRWLDALPDEHVRAHPRLRVYHALVLFAAGQNDAAERSLQAAERAIDSISDRGGTELRGVLAAARAFIAFSQGDLSTIIRSSRQALDHLPARDLMWRSIANYTLGLAQRLSGNLGAAHQTLSKAVTLSSKADNSYITLVSQLNLARLQTQRGRLRRASEILRQALRLADEKGMLGLPVAGLLSAELGSILIEQNELGEAMGLLEKGAELIERGEDITALEMTRAFMVRGLYTKGDIGGAMDLIQEMEQVARQADVGPWLAHWIAALKLQVYVGRGDLAAAAQLSEELGLSVEDDPIYQREMVYSPLVRLFIAQGQPEAVMGLLGRLLRAAETEGRLGRVITTLALRALALQAQGEIEPAMADLSRALSFAESEGYVRIFVDEGAPMVQLLRRAASRGISPEYASKLLTAFDLAESGTCSSVQPLIEPLSQRELDVLRLLTTDLTLEEIAQELFVARSTVRSHTKSIYGKLNVHSRREAVRRAQELDLL
jgi:LuxR family maltose regulon positive regulatory protein